ncbi:hypothetical protein RF11_05980 [Thelohanellus kitauei]|uniref:Uncharacterized protein n=1 Tax=Thelohanellus kitauei TaxID=669202 RepID=A0A0C2J779_THEKT|nr:hypothetical protein RF11_05980 [Thelohanellus kitauei]
MDPRMNLLYYHDKNSIYVLHTRFCTKKTFYRTGNYVYFLKLDSDIDQLYVSFVERGTQKIVVTIMTTSGDELKSFSISEKVEDMGHSEGYYHIYTEKKLIKADLNNSLEEHVFISIN